MAVNFYQFGIRGFSDSIASLFSIGQLVFCSNFPLEATLLTSEQSITDEKPQDNIHLSARFF
jgi:hypothetical protein